MNGTGELADDPAEFEKAVMMTLGLFPDVRRFEAVVPVASLKE